MCIHKYGFTHNYTINIDIIKSLLARLFIVGKQGQALFYSGLAIRDVSHLSTKVCRLISSIDVYRRL